MVDLSLSLIWPPLVGGALIGLAAALLMLFNGRIAGISGIVGGALTTRSRDAVWRWAFTGGLVAGGVLMLAWMPSAFDNLAPRTLPVLALAGLLVGFGTRLGSGCTSGHGVCGISRISRRSLVATAVFMTTGVLAATAGQRLLAPPPAAAAPAEPVALAAATPAALADAPPAARPARGAVSEITPEAAWARRGAARFVDVREPDELVGPLGQAPGVEAIPLARLADAAAGWDRAKPVVVICRSGRRSLLAARQLEALGFADAASVAGGMQAWHTAGLPVVRPPATAARAANPEL